MELESAFLADHAEAVNGKLYVNGGLVTRLSKTQLPSPLDVSLVVILEHTRQEANTAHQLEVRIVDADGQPIVPPFSGVVQISPVLPGTPTGLRFTIPVAFRLNMPVSGPGLYAAVIMLGPREVGSVAFAVESPTPPDE